MKINGEDFSWNLEKIRENYFHLIYNDQSITAEVVSVDWNEKSFRLKIGDQVHDVEIKDDMDLLLEKMGISNQNAAAMTQVKAPMPGLILDILVEPGHEVKKGDQLLILEAMKMENILKAQGDGTIKSIEVSQGDSVEKNQVLIIFN